MPAHKFLHNLKILQHNISWPMAANFERESGTRKSTRHNPLSRPSYVTETDPDDAEMLGEEPPDNDSGSDYSGDEREKRETHRRRSNHDREFRQSMSGRKRRISQKQHSRSPADNQEVDPSTARVWLVMNNIFANRNGKF